ncbi:hypothetical protein [Hyphomicrobium sp.]|jgi:hypothetical protein|uniref:hypothetical protein n=1 Tax=Hyphomicrobium sp. TaxID=82 RepID=UPI003563A2FF
MRIYIPLLAIDAIALLIALYFFVVGIGDGTVSSFNILLWLAVLGGLSAIILAGRYFRTRRRLLAANVVLAIVGVPAILAGLFVISLLISQPRWN